MRVAGWPEREIGAIAARQRALITRAQLTALGLSRAGDRSRGRSWSSAPPPPRGLLIGAVCRAPAARAELAAVLACGDARSAQPPLRRGHVGLSSVLQWSRPRDRDRQRRRPRPPRHPGSPGQPSSIPATSAATRGSRSPPRPVRCSEIAPDLTDRELERALDEALIERLVTHAAIAAVVNAYPNRRGVARLRAARRPRPPHHRNALRRRRSAAGADPQSKPPRPRSQRQSRQLHRRLPLAPHRR